MDVFIILLIIVGIFVIVYTFAKRKKNIPVPEALDDEQQKLFDIAMDLENTKQPVMFALTTCRHCRSAATLLEENDKKLTMIYIDNFPKEAREKLMAKVREYNPRGSFPTIYLLSKNVIIGYREQQIREAIINEPSRSS